MDLIYNALNKLAGGRDVVDNFVPTGPKLMTPKEGVRTMGKDFSTDSAIQSVVPVNVTKTVSSIQGELAETAGSLSPENVIGSGGPIDVPEPPKLGLKAPRLSGTTGMAIPGPSQMFGGKSSAPPMPKSPERLMNETKAKGRPLLPHEILG